MHIEYTISAEDYLAAQKVAMKHYKPTQTRVMFQWLPIFGLMLLGFVFYTGFTQGFSTSLVPGLVFPLIFVSLWFTRNISFRKMYAKATNMHGPLILDVDDDGLRFRGATFDSQIRWAHYSSFCEDQNSLLFFQNTPIFNILPKRCLSEEQTATLRALCAQHIVRKS